LKSALSALKVIQVEGETKIITPLPKSQTFRFIEVESYPDDFYSDLVRIINRAYNTELYVPLLILVRKLFENVLIDIFRSFYGMQAVNTFYDINNGKFHDFSLLLRTARQKLKDFNLIKDYFNEKLLDVLDKYREQGNASAHNLAIRISKEEIDKSRDEIIYATKSLFKIISLVINARLRGGQV